MEIVSAKETEGVGRDSGNPYTKIDIAFKLVEHAETGELRGTPFVYDAFFVSSGPGLDRFMKLFTAITGYTPEEGEIDPDTGELTTDTEDLLDEIRDRDVWGVVVYGDKRDDGKYRVNTGWSFANSADGVSLPRRIRDAVSA
jgi:hypothetical protein